MLEVEGIHTFYGLSHILFGISLSVEQEKWYVSWVVMEQGRPPP
jgi:ABC-type branched-subunit amino acid transport system ATPase component